MWTIRVFLKEGSTIDVLVRDKDEPIYTVPNKVGEEVMVQVGSSPFKTMFRISEIIGWAVLPG